MSKIQFKEILERYLSGTCSPDERKLVEQWYELLDEDYRVLYPDMNLEELEEIIWEKVKPEAEIIALHTPQKSSWKWSIAASITLLIGVGIWLYWDKSTGIKGNLAQTEISEGLVEVKNNTRLEKLVDLPDGSQVTLTANSSIEFSKKWASDKREVFLTGTAFFKVKRNPEQPFLVYANDIVTKVLGTSFWIRAKGPEQKVEISVVTGKVSVFKRDAKADYISENIKSGVILTPNQQVDYFPENQVFVTGIVKEPQLILPEKSTVSTSTQIPSFVYDEASVGQVLKEIERAYGIEIILENDTINDCPITADLSKNSLYTKLDIICATLKATYEIRGTKILISGKGC